MGKRQLYEHYLQVTLPVTIGDVEIVSMLYLLHVDISCEILALKEVLNDQY